MKMDLKINVLTLNCWGIVGVSRHRKERMSAIASHIAESKYDFVFLQEVWDKSDFEMISKKASGVLPYSHYFYSGVLGSGVCILSQSCIVDVAQFQYSLNGYFHKIIHGDWFGGKLVGLCRVMHHGLKINLYVTHLHAEYDSNNDVYLPHRLVQAFEFSQFVRMTSESADLSIVAGDINTECQALPYRLIVHNSGCTDCFMERPNHSDNAVDCTTCGHPDNLYTTKAELRCCPTGKRIDYVMYKCGIGTSVKCLHYETPLYKIPDTSIPYSDHEAVVSQLHIFKSSQSTVPLSIPNPEGRIEAIKDSNDILQDNMKDLGYKRLFFSIMGCVIAVVLIVASVIELPHCFYALVLLVQIISTLGIAFCLWMAIITYKIEYNALLATCKSMEVLINALACEYGFNVPVASASTSGYSEIIP